MIDLPLPTLAISPLNPHINKVLIHSTLGLGGFLDWSADQCLINRTFVILRFLNLGINEMDIDRALLFRGLLGGCVDQGYCRLSRSESPPDRHLRCACLDCRGRLCPSVSEGLMQFPQTVGVWRLLERSGIVNLPLTAIVWEIGAALVRADNA